MLEAGLLVEGERVVDFAANPLIEKVLFEGVTASGSQDAEGELIPDVVVVSVGDREDDFDVIFCGPRLLRRGAMTVNGVGLGDSGDLTELLNVVTGVALATDGVFRVVRDFDSQDGGLESVDPEVAADEVMEVLGLHAMIPKNAGFFGQGIILGDKRARISEAAKILAGEETVGAEIAHGATGAAPIAGADGLSGVFDDL